MKNSLYKPKVIKLKEYPLLQFKVWIYDLEIKYRLEVLHITYNSNFRTSAFVEKIETWREEGRYIIPYLISKHKEELPKLYVNVYSRPYYDAIIENAHKITIKDENSLLQVIESIVNDLKALNQIEVDKDNKVIELDNLITNLPDTI